LTGRSKSKVAACEVFMWGKVLPGVEPARTRTGRGGIGADGRAASVTCLQVSTSARKLILM